MRPALLVGPAGTFNGGGFWAKYPVAYRQVLEPTPAEELLKATPYGQRVGLSLQDFIQVSKVKPAIDWGAPKIKPLVKHCIS